MSTDRNEEIFKRLNSHDVFLARIDENQGHILSKLDEAKEDRKNGIKELHDAKIKINTLETRSKSERNLTWGGGGIAAIVLAVWEYLKAGGGQ
ncbi:MAG: hypothetical protein ABJN40_05965 [Sneathiella sp.]